MKIDRGFVYSGVIVPVLLVGVSPVAAAPLARPAAAISITDLIDQITNALSTLALLGIVLWGLAQVLPDNVLDKVGLNIPKDYLMRLLVAAVVLGASSVIVSTLF